MILTTILEFWALVMAVGGWMLAGKLNQARRGHGVSKVELI